jgi:hypothetical protein
VNVSKILISIARFGWKKIIKPAVVEHGPEIVADVVRRRKGKTTARRDEENISPARPDSDVPDNEAF